MTPLEAEVKARRFLDRWQPWMVMAYVGIVIALVGLFLALSKVAHEQAKREAALRATYVTQVASCYTQRKNGPGVIALLNLIDGLAENTLKGSRAALLADPTSPLTPIREASIERITKQQEQSKTIIKQAKASIPTEKKCDALAKRLQVDPTPYKPKEGT